MRWCDEEQGAADRPVILDAHQEHSAGPVGQTDHRLDKVAVVQPFSLLALELDLIGLPASDPLRDTQASPLPYPTASPCASSLYAKLCDTSASVSSDAHNFTRARITALAARHLRHHAPPVLVDAPGNLAPPGSQCCRQNPDLHERGTNTPESDVGAERRFRARCLWSSCRGPATLMADARDATDWLPIPSVLLPVRWAVATRLSPGRGQAVPVPDKPEAGIRGHSDSADVAGGSVLAGDHHVHLSVDSVDDVFELGYILLQRIDVG
jgi:hypothetical protein